MEHITYSLGRVGSAKRHVIRRTDAETVWSPAFVVVLMAVAMLHHPLVCYVVPRPSSSDGILSASLARTADWYVASASNYL